MALPTASTGLRTHSLFDVLLSALIVVVALIFFVFMVQRTSTGHFGSYEITVRLPSADGLSVGCDIRLGGVKVGTVSELSLGSDYNAVVRMSLRDDIFLPNDSFFSISSQLGNSVFLNISPGHSPRIIVKGAVVNRSASKMRPRTKTKTPSESLQRKAHQR